MFRIVHHGVEIFCDTVDDALAIAARLAGASEPSGTKHSHPAPQSSQANTTRWTVSRFSTFMSELQEQQKKMLKALLSSPDGQTDTSLKQHLGLSSNKAFGPILTGISRKAKKVGVSLTDVLTSERITVGNDRVLEFKACPAFASVAKEAGGIK